MKQTSHFDIGLDYRMAAHTGIGTYLRGLVNGFTANQSPEGSRLALYKPNSLAGDTSFSQMFFDAPIYSIREQWNYRELLKTCRLWHAPHYNVPYFKGTTKLVTTIHDIIHLKFKHTLNLFQRSYAELMLKRAVSLSDHIMTVSEHTKKDLIENFRANPKKITVAYNGVSPDFHPIPSTQLEFSAALLRKKYALPESFLLYVGMIKPHKNVLRLLKAFLDLKSKNQIRTGLVIIGKGSTDSTEMKLIRSQIKVTHIEQIEKGELPIFYNMAQALVHPSLYEGFGLTVVEAMACGTPVVTTTRASLPEVGGDAAIYINGEDDHEMAQVLLDLDKDKNVKSKYATQCMNQAHKFSWAQSALQTAQIYDTVLRQ